MHFNSIPGRVALLTSKSGSHRPSQSLLAPFISPEEPYYAWPSELREVAQDFELSSATIDNSKEE